jgi:hypothetical protein
MQRLLVVTVAAAGLILAGCSDDEMGDAGMSAKDKAAAAVAGTARPQTAMPAARKLPAGAIDHSRDEKEFELRRSLGGVERMISTYEASGYDTAELKARKAELEQSLSRLSG